MSKAMDGFYRFLDEPIFPWARVVLALLTIFVGLSFTAPMWHINMQAPQYPEGLDLYIYSYKVDGGNDGNDVHEINALNHYIGMAPLDRAALTDLDWIPFLFAAMIIFALRTAVIGKVSTMIDLLVMTTYAGIFGFGRLYYKLYTFGHNLDPKSASHSRPIHAGHVGAEANRELPNRSQSRARHGVRRDFRDWAHAVGPGPPVHRAAAARGGAVAT